ncbi:SGNH/GDSL hydrolase family protein [Streptacidiphilus fuscans]|uniref:SGNH/GDSL hydrolase family protein n=1 Tax=Streptacidiphilus fuscans TaxID=2789292 RepID=A0A931AXQ1_9ACTN|nr:SGNH/GDSL hydrolase family protein [Streptacidiphilus fuscans]MBF9066478.1 SGNH/GDSL hydrolase family protein [Streptacidiphilus fuscans]
MRRPVRIAAALAAGIMAASVPTLVGADTASAATSGASYAALGDSYSSGYGASSTYLNTCAQSTAAYPYLYDQATAPASFDFAACAGATTSDVVSTQLGGLNSGTTLVSMTIGGNDVGLVDVAAACSAGTDSQCSAAVATAAEAAVTQLPGALDTLFTDVRNDAPNARVVVLGYPELFDTSATNCVLLDQNKRTAIADGADVLNAAIAAETSQHSGFVYQDVVHRFAGHELCDAAPWIDATTLHPTADGQADAYLPALEAGA